MAGLRKRTMRKMLPATKFPITRKLARLQGEVASVNRRMKNLIPEVKDLEFELRALHEENKVLRENPPRKEVTSEGLDEIGKHQLAKMSKDLTF